VRSKGIPEKQGIRPSRSWLRFIKSSPFLGWVRGLVMGQVKEQRCFCWLIDKSIQWFKNPPGKIVGQEPVRGKITGLGKLLLYQDFNFNEIVLIGKSNTNLIVDQKGRMSSKLSLVFMTDISDREAVSMS
jgi:hypothetical protein